MKKNTLGDLNDHLFAEIERLSDEDLGPEEMDREIARAKSMTAVASQIISGGHLQMKFMQLQAEYSTVRNNAAPECFRIADNG